MGSQHRQRASDCTRRVAALAGIGLATLIAFAATAAAQAPVEIGRAPEPKQSWQRGIDLLLPVPPANPGDERPDPLATILELTSRTDGGAIVVGFDPAAPGNRRVRVIAIDGSGKDIYARNLSEPPGTGTAGATTLSVAVSVDQMGRAWLFQTWRNGTDPAADDGLAFSRLVGLDAAGNEFATARLPDKIAGLRDLDPRRYPRVMRSMGDGSPIVVGTAWGGPPIWWFARFGVNGRLLYEQASRRFPDYIEDAHVNPDGGFSLLMIDAEDGPETVTLRRHDAGGRLVARHRLPELPQAISCAVLVGPMQQMRVISNGQNAEPTRSEVVWHEAGRGIVRRLDLGARACESLARAGNTVLLITTGLPIVDDAPGTVVAFVDGSVRWMKAMDGFALAAAASNGGALVLHAVTENGKPGVKLARYRTP